MNFKRVFRKILVSSLNNLTWFLLFSIAYTQSPLFTSNQNQYFLHGLAAAGLGTLQSDWLANTSDPTPLFSQLVKLSYLAFENTAIFYLFSIFLLELYFVTSLRIAELLTGLRRSQPHWLFLAALLVLIHSAGWRFLLSRLLGANWAYLLEDGLADQRMLGPVFQPSTFGVFLLVAVFCFLKRQYFWAALSIAAACAFHPTYLLSAAMLTTAMLWVRWIETHDPGKTLAFGGLALLGVLPVVFYVAGSFGVGASDAAEGAREILVAYRIPHHAQIAMWFDHTAVLKIMIIAGGILVLKPALRSAIQRTLPGDAAPLELSAGQRLGLVLLATGSMAGILTLAQALSADARLALLFPWRISTLLVPLAVLALLTAAFQRWLPADRLLNTPLRKLLPLLSTLILFCAVLVGMVRLKLDFDRKAGDAERGVQAYVYANHQPGDIFLTPVKMQDFRLFAAAPVYVDFKSIPYQDQDVLEWYRRIHLADRYYNEQDCRIPAQLAQQEALTHVLQPSEMPPCPDFAEVYSDSAYNLYRITVR